MLTTTDEGNVTQSHATKITKCYPSVVHREGVGGGGGCSVGVGGCTICAVHSKVNASFWVWAVWCGRRVQWCVLCWCLEWDASSQEVALAVV